MVIEAMMAFNREFDNLNNQNVPADQSDLFNPFDPLNVPDNANNTNILPEGWESSLTDYYTNEFLPRLSQAVSGDLNPKTYIPQSKAAKYLQYHYIANNPNPVGEKSKLVNAKDGSSYSQVHAKYQNKFQSIAEKFGYYDLFLIDFTTGDIVYSIYKEADYGTNLNTGPYQYSNLGKLVELVRKNPERQTVQIVDFEFYRPSYGAPAAFLGAPIYDGSQIVGILAVQLPIDELDSIMTAKGQWAEVGLGESGETYLVGSDFLMRSNSRFLIEDPEGFIKVSSQTGTSEENIRQIKEFNTSILLQKIDSDAAQSALRSQSGTEIVKDYRNVNVLSSYTPLKIKGLNWVLLSEMDLAEAYKPVHALQIYIFMTTVIVIVCITWIASAAASSFLKPFNELITGFRRVIGGENDVKLKIDSDDEFGEAKERFNQAVDRLNQVDQQLQQKTHDNDVLLSNILPETVIARLKQGETQIADSIKLATMMFARLEGWDQIGGGDIKQLAILMSELISAFDSAAVKHEVSKLKTNGDLYIASCGVAKQRLDSTKRMMAFAIDMFKITNRFNNEHNLKVRISMGIDDGPLMAAVLGTDKFSYDVWGETVSVADFLQLNAVPGTLLVTEEVYERLEGLYDFEPAEDIVLPEIGQTLTTWLLKDPTAV
jgi:class 3 adenylate cyclase